MTRIYFCNAMVISGKEAVSRQRRLMLFDTKLKVVMKFQREKYQSRSRVYGIESVQRKVQEMLMLEE